MAMEWLKNHWVLAKSGDASARRKLLILVEMCANIAPNRVRLVAWVHIDLNRLARCIQSLGRSKVQRLPDKVKLVHMGCVVLDSGVKGSYTLITTL